MFRPREHRSGPRLHRCLMSRYCVNTWQGAYCYLVRESLISRTVSKQRAALAQEIVQITPLFLLADFESLLVSTAVKFPTWVILRCTRGASRIWKLGRLLRNASGPDACSVDGSVGTIRCSSYADPETVSSTNWKGEVERQWRSCQDSKAR